MASRAGRPFSFPGFGQIYRNRGLHHKAAGPGIGDAKRTQRRERERLHDVALAAGWVRRQRTDQPFDQQAGDPGRGNCRILLRQTALGDRGSDPAGKFSREASASR